ncbi:MULTISPECIES: hypothetical protein [Micromonospora]|uniref:SUKH-3 immunity protein n=1 Tax=Micromonospora solifontis TaxID=2487138 RepID=A0ABX9WMM9_9ACTN|nr:MULTISPECIES: hypothetical protein [Micromonospora]NES13273.1 hypothetical protein [Micromonospora sp. PPF5-17B]NES34642.1 hypothetical protein [Micromonospora solifontis]NES56994.1 hypothetical protein [Micromonospora sp. PPF5-6]RNM01885.1 hypothetical protein EFE23_00455 [Micromonospora solifontis]
MKATHNPPTTAPVTPADLLRMAALYLRRHGWHQGTYYNNLFPTDFPTPPACAVGAIGMACAGHRADHFYTLDIDTQITFRQTVGVFTTYLDDHEPICAIDDDGFLIDEHTSPYSWNDDPARTAEQVITALESAADEWDRLHMQGGENR